MILVASSPLAKYFQTESYLMTFFPVADLFLKNLALSFAIIDSITSHKHFK